MEISSKQIPNLNGNWNGFILSSYDKTKKIPAKAKIIQTYFSISIVLKTKNSVSTSTHSKLYVNNAGNIEISYTYHNVPNNFSDSELRQHDGTAQIEYEKQDQKLFGKYYTNQRDRDNYGTFELNRK